ncbi:hypothetical protein CEQ90_16980 [Lewinellaceae bacterium SD302]|nr:hypothetical protein CEQ90_16980 [Lewinellaceae bacterium SD302]
MKYFYPVLLLLLGSVSLLAQSNDQLRSVQLEATVGSNEITLSWDDAVTPVNNITVFRREVTGEENGWGTALATLDTFALEYLDATVLPNVLYEYRVVRPGPENITGYGYLFTGIELPSPVQRGVLLLVVEDSLFAELTPEIERYRQDARADGWRVKTLLVSADTTDVAVKAAIAELYDQEPEQRHTLFLLGHVPVPYSGNLYPDGHTNHEGAWPADGFYADLDGNWTDQTVNNTVANGTRNDNVPGDGKWDQSSIPSSLELEIGRVDFHNLPQFSETATELTRAYLDKNHAFRRGIIEIPHRGLIENNFASFAEGFGQNGLKNFATMVGRDSTRYLDYNTLKTESYLLSYGCGGGNFQGAGGIANTTAMANDSFQSVFTFLFGSYFGDWDAQNNFLRASLGSGTVLATAWAGRPNWALHPMGLGATIGFCAKRTQNNEGFSYIPGFGNRGVHVALLGDPTLRMHIVKPPQQLTATENEDGILIEWTAGEADNIEGYHLYKFNQGSGEYTRITQTPTPELSYLDACPTTGEDLQYLVKTIRLESSPSGTFYNESHGAEVEILPMIEREVTTAFTFTTNAGEVQFTDQSENANVYNWDFGDGNGSNEASPLHTYTSSGTYLARLIANNFCTVDSSEQTVQVIISDLAGFDELGARVFPNPVISGQLYISLPPGIEPESLELLDATGQVRWRAAAESNGNYRIATEDFPGGMYVLKMHLKGQSYVRKIMIIK